MHATRQTVNYMYRTTPYQLYNWSGNRSDKFVLSPLEFDRLKLTMHMLHHVPLRFWKWIAEKKRWIWEHFDIANLLITYFSIFERTFQINDKNLIDCSFFPFLTRELRACARASYRDDVGNAIRSLARSLARSIGRFL